MWSDSVTVIQQLSNNDGPIVSERGRVKVYLLGLKSSTFSHYILGKSWFLKIYMYIFKTYEIYWRVFTFFWGPHGLNDNSWFLFCVPFLLVWNRKLTSKDIFNQDEFQTWN